MTSLSFCALAHAQAKLLEHNVRFGDPECQSLMARCESDVTEALLLASTGRLDKVDLKWSHQAAVTVVMAAKGYPGDYSKGTVIRGLEAVSGAKVCHTRTRTSGGSLTGRQRRRRAV